MLLHLMCPYTHEHTLTYSNNNDAYSQQWKRHALTTMGRHALTAVGDTRGTNYKPTTFSRLQLES